MFPGTSQQRSMRMRVNKVKRRLIRWYRYTDHTHSRSTNSRLGGYHAGHVKAYSGVMYARRYSPIGIREPWVLTTEPGGS